MPLDRPHFIWALTLLSVLAITSILIIVWIKYNFHKQDRAAAARSNRTRAAEEARSTELQHLPQRVPHPHFDIGFPSTWTHPRPHLARAQSDRNQTKPRHKKALLRFYRRHRRPSLPMAHEMDLLSVPTSLPAVGAFHGEGVTGQTSWDSLQVSPMVLGRQLEAYQSLPDLPSAVREFV